MKHFFKLLAVGLFFSSVGGGAAPVNQQYDDYSVLARETGGAVYSRESINQPEVKNLQLLDLQSALFLMYSIHLNTDRIELPILIDSSMKNVLLNFSYASSTIPKLTLYLPDGKVAESLPSIEKISINKSIYFIIKNPQPGLWKAQILGSGIIQLRAKSDSRSDIAKIDFVELSGRPGHRGLMSTKKALQPGSSHTVSMNLQGIKNPKFYLVDADGMKLKNTLEIVTSNADDLYDSFLLKITIPSKPFRLVLEGQNKEGGKLYRDLGMTFTPGPQLVSVEVDGTRELSAQECTSLSQLGLFTSNQNKEISLALFCMINHGKNLLGVKGVFPYHEGKQQFEVVSTRKYDTASTCQQTVNLIHQLPLSPSTVLGTPISIHASCVQQANETHVLLNITF